MGDRLCHCGRPKSPDARRCRECLRPPPPPIPEALTRPIVPVAQAMADRGMSIEDLSARSGVCVRSVLYARAGYAVRREMAEAIAHVLGINPGVMLVGAAYRGIAPRREEDNRQQVLKFEDET